MLDNKSAAEEIRECIGDITSSKTSKNVFSYVKGIIQQQNPSAEQNATSTSALESWNILCACTKTQPLWQRSIWEIAKPSFPNILKADDIAVRCSSIRFLNSYAEALSERAAEDSMTNAAIDWWTDVLECYLQQATQDENSQIRALACDCMSALSERVFEAMTPRRQTLCISLLLPLAEDGNSDVRAAACHALGILVVFPSLREVSIAQCLYSMMPIGTMKLKLYSPGSYVRNRCGACNAATNGRQEPFCESPGKLGTGKLV
jgi:hypothetical protein